MNEKLRMGIIGCGQITKAKYATAIINNIDCEIASVCDINQERAIVAAQEWGAPSWHTDYKKMLADPLVDAVLVNTPHAFHAECVIGAAQAAKHILVEKPMAIDRDQIDAMIAAAKENAVKLVTLPFQFSESFLRCQELISSGFIGDLVSVQGFSTKDGFPPFPWYLAKEAGIGSVADIGIYSIGAAIALMGPVRSVFAKMTTGSSPVQLADGKHYPLEQEDTARLILEWDSGIIGSITCGWGQGDSGTFVTISGRQGALTLSGWGNEKLTLKTGNKAKVNGLESMEDLFRKRYLLNHKACWGKEVIAYFVEAIRNDTDMSADLDRTRHTMDVIFKAYESAVAGRPMQIDSTFSPIN